MGYTCPVVEEALKQQKFDDCYASYLLLGRRNTEVGLIGQRGGQQFGNGFNSKFSLFEKCSKSIVSINLGSYYFVVVQSVKQALVIKSIIEA